MTHTIETLMALADAYAEQMHRCGVGRLSQDNRATLHAALTEALEPSEYLNAVSDMVLEKQKAAQPVREQLHVGDSSFESWYESYPRQGISKQVARDAYAAGMSDPLVQAQQVQASTDFHILSITTAYEQGVGKGHQAFKRGNDIENPYAAPSDCAKAWDYGYEEGKIQASRLGDKT